MFLLRFRFVFWCMFCLVCLLVPSWAPYISDAGKRLTPTHSQLPKAGAGCPGGCVVGRGVPRDLVGGRVPRLNFRWGGVLRRDFRWGGVPRGVRSGAGVPRGMRGWAGVPGRCASYLGRANPMGDTQMRTKQAPMYMFSNG